MAGTVSNGNEYVLAAWFFYSIRQRKVSAVFLENMYNPKLIAQLSKDAGATLGATLYADALLAPDKP